jgi:hypothetical protein
MIWLPLGFAVLGCVDSLGRFSPVRLPRALIRVVTVALSLSGAWMWERTDWVLAGLAAAGVTIAITALVNALTGEPAPPPRRRGPKQVRPPSPGVGNRVPRLP